MSSNRNIKNNSRPAAPTAPAAMANEPKPQTKADIALSKDIYYFAKKSEAVHNAIKEVWDGTPFLEVAKKYNKSPEEMAIAFAVFGKQAIDISREKGVFYDTAYLAMGFQKDGYDTENEMGRALPRAIGIKRDEANKSKRDKEAAGQQGRQQGQSQEQAGDQARYGQGVVRRGEGGPGMVTISYGLYGGTGISAPDLSHLRR